MQHTKIQVMPSQDKMPKVFVYSVVMLCAAPFLLNLLGFDFGSQVNSIDLEAAKSFTTLQLLDAYFYRMSGAFTHTLLEWSAFAAAIFTVCLAFSHFVLTKDLTTPVIGAALFLAGCMDAFHTLAADRLIEAVADNSNLVPFTWALCRLFNALILIIGVTVLMIRSPKSAAANIRFLTISCIVFAVIAYAIINIAATSETLPQTQYPDGFITRPYDAVPLLFYLFAGLYLFPKFYKKRPSIFAHALIIAMIPETVVEAHMAFGSSDLFDNHFNIAHFLKILAYVVPFCGLLMDYVHTYRNKEREIAEREQAELALRENMAELENTNQELDKFAYIASHDLKAPLRGIDHLATWIEEDMEEDPEATKEHLRKMGLRIKRMETLLDDLLTYSRIGRKKMARSTVDTQALVEQLFEMASPPKGFKLKILNGLPTITTFHVPFELVFRNLINNAVKHHRDEVGVISIGVKTLPKHYEFMVQDDGPGIDKEFHAKIFDVFQTLQSRDQVEGSGIGLALVKKVTHVYGGTVRVESELGAGTRFYIEWPKTVKVVSDDEDD